MRQEVNEKAQLLQLGAQTYESVDVPLDHFSPGFRALLGVSERDLSETRERVVKNLSSLENDDPEWQAFYSSRREHFQALSLDVSESASSAEVLDPRDLQSQALRALDRGDIDQVARLADSMTHRKAPDRIEQSISRPAVPADPDLSWNFSQTSLHNARKLGLFLAKIEEDRDLHGYVRCCCAWQLTFMEYSLTPGRRRTDSCTCSHRCPPNIPETLRETLDLLMVHPFISSCGVRYLPGFSAEQVLVEEFSEASESTWSSELLVALELKSRRGVSRTELEEKLLRHGNEIVGGELGLDPHEFRLICIPFDLYSRLGASRGWGHRRLWTHFDGYQLLKNRKQRALVGGDMRFGGIYDLCSISRNDEREKVVARLCVVRRKRLGPEAFRT